MPEINIKIFVGEEVIPYIRTIAEMRIRIFKEYPYLYMGNLEYEEKYLQSYSLNAKAMLAVAYSNEKVVGISTGIPLLSESEIINVCENSLKQQDKDPSKYYYYGEILIEHNYRGLGISSKLYKAQDALASSWGFKHTSILTVHRSDNHPLRPQNYKDSNCIWEHLGFFKNLPPLTIRYNWPTIQADGSIVDDSNLMEFWERPLHALSK